MVGLKKRFYGRGPTAAKSFINDNYVFCVLDGGLTQTRRRCWTPVKNAWCASTGCASRK